MSLCRQVLLVSTRYDEPTFGRFHRNWVLSNACCWTFRTFRSWIMFACRSADRFCAVIWIPVTETEQLFLWFRCLHDGKRSPSFYGRWWACRGNCGKIGWLIGSIYFIVLYTDTQSNSQLSASDMVNIFVIKTERKSLSKYTSESNKQGAIQISINK